LKPKFCVQSWAGFEDLAKTVVGVKCEPKTFKFRFAKLQTSKFIWKVTGFETSVTI
jgi:hypothetical protein